MKPLISKNLSRVMSLRDGLSKMSKSDASDYSRINLRDSIDEISLKFKKAKSDPNPLPYSVKELEDRHEAKNLVGIYSALSKKTETEVLNEFGGKGFGAFKPALADLAVSVLEPINHDLNKLLEDKGYLIDILNKGSQKASKVSGAVLSEVRNLVGFVR